RTPYASLFSIHLWIPRVLIVQNDPLWIVLDNQHPSIFFNYEKMFFDNEIKIKKQGKQVRKRSGVTIGIKFAKY
ncbi:hypothetical protein, partial [Aneurinibacillus aneurinilyticus]